MPAGKRSISVFRPRRGHLITRWGKETLLALVRVLLVKSRYQRTIRNRSHNQNTISLQFS